MDGQDKLHVWDSSQIEEKAEELYYKWNGATSVKWSARSEELKKDYRQVAVKYLNTELMTKSDLP